MCPKAHWIPANHPDRVALRVEARNNGPGVRTPEELAITTVSKKSAVIKPSWWASELLVVIKLV